MATEKMLDAAYEAYKSNTGADDIHLHGWLRIALEAAIDAALSQQDPVAWVFKNDLKEGDGSFGSTKGEVCRDRYGDWVNVDTPLYAGPHSKDAE